VLLSELNRDGRVQVVEFALSQPKAKEGARFLKELKVDGMVVIVLGAENPSFERGVRNVAGVKVMLSKDLNVFDLAKTDWLLLDQASLGQLKERLS